MGRVQGQGSMVRNVTEPQSVASCGGSMCGGSWDRVPAQLYGHGFVGTGCQWGGSYTGSV